MSRAGNERLSGKDIVIPVKAGTKIHEATMVAIGADGYAIPATKAADLKIAGCALKFVNNTLGSDGSEKVHVRRGAYVWNNDGTIKSTDILKDAYVSDKDTVTITTEGSSKAGKILDVDDDGVVVEIL